VILLASLKILATVIGVVVPLPSKFHPTDTGVVEEVLLPLAEDKRKKDKKTQVNVLVKRLKFLK
jgi:hypothetical protein